MNCSKCGGELEVSETVRIQEGHGVIDGFRYVVRILSCVCGFRKEQKIINQTVISEEG